MPRVTRRRKLRRPGLTPQCLDQLLTGSTLSCTLGYGPLHKYPHPGVDIERMQRDWQELREVILAEWTRRIPRTRPAAWYRFDLPESLRPPSGECDWRCYRDVSIVGAAHVQQYPADTYVEWEACCSRPVYLRLRIKEDRRQAEARFLADAGLLTRGEMELVG